MERQTKRFLLAHYFMAVVTPLVIAGVMQISWPLLRHDLIGPYLIAVMLCAWYGGLGPGLLSLLISLLIVDYFFMQPYFSLGPPEKGDLTRLVTFAVVGSFVSVLSESLHRSRRLAEINLDAIKRAEEALREKERFANQIAELSPVVINVFDLATRRSIYVSPDVVSLFGYSAKEMLEMEDPFSVLWHPEDIPRASENFARLQHCKNGEIPEFEYRIRRRDGEWRWVASRGMPFEHNGEGEVRQIISATVDVTERKLAEEKLKQSEIQLAEAQHLANVGSWNRDLKNNTLSWSDELYHIFGVQPSEFEPTFETIMGFFHIEDRDLVRRVVDDSITTHEPFSFYYRIIRPDGKERIIHSIGRVATDAHGDPIRLFGAAQDVTERQQTEHALRAAEGKYRDIFENAGEGIFQSTADGRFLVSNPALARMLGFDSPEELIRSVNNISRQVYVDPKRREEFKHLLDATGMVRAFEHQVLRKDGSKIWISVNARVVRDEQGSVRYYEGTAQDITDRKRAEEALRESEERYRELFENAKDAIYVQDLRGIYISVNPEAEKLTGYDRNEIIGKHFEQFVAPEYLPLVRTELAKKVVDKKQTAYEVEVIAKDGRRVPVELNSALIFKHGVPVGIQGIARDITERKRAESSLRNYSRLLIEAQEAERQSIARELHDQIGQVLTAIRINLQTVRKSCETSESKALIDEGTGMVDQALEQVRDLSFELRPSLLDDLGLVAALRWYGDRYAQRTGIRTTTVTNLASGQVRLRKELETACFRIVQEALTNVARHAQARNVIINLGTLDKGISLSIKDDGIGFDEHSRSADASPQLLGLRGMQERALALGGKLEINSVASRGTEIWAHFPNGQ